MHRLFALIVLVCTAVFPAAPAGAEDPVPAARQRAVAWMHTQQLPDGGFGVRNADGSYRSNAIATADAMYVLALAGEQALGPAWTVNGKTLLDALAATAPGYVGDDAGQAGKVARAVALVGKDPHNFAGMDLIAIIRKPYDPVTGRFHPELAFRHTLALEALLRAREQVPPAALDALLTSRHPEGGWFWAFSGNQSDVDSTGRFMQLLANQAGVRCGPALDATAAFLAQAQDPAGGWGVGYLPGPPNANSTALAVAGLRAAGYDLAAPRFRKNGHSALEALLAFQEPSGAFVYIRQPGQEESRLMATIDALNALSQPQVEGPCAELYLPAVLRSKS